MKTKIRKWGNSLAIRLPLHIVNAKGISEGDELIVTIENDKIVVLPVSKEETLDSLVKKINVNNQHHETDWGEEFARETW